MCASAATAHRLQPARSADARDCPSGRKRATCIQIVSAPAADISDTAADRHRRENTAAGYCLAAPRAAECRGSRIAGGEPWATASPPIPPARYPTIPNKHVVFFHTQMSEIVPDTIIPFHTQMSEIVPDTIPFPDTIIPFLRLSFVT